MTRFRTTIDPAQLHEALLEDAVTVVDCSFELTDPGAGRIAFLAGHLPGARYLHLDQDLAGPTTGSNGRHPLPDPEVLARKLRQEGVSNGRQVVAYDSAGGPYAARLWWLLRWLGHDAVAVLDGGKQAWQRAGYPLESGAPAPAAAGDFAPSKIRENMVVTADMVAADLAEKRLVVVDARSPARFRGEPNALDPVAGHIPGARNRFFMDNLTPEGSFKQAARLAAEFDAVLGGADAAQVVLQCGSGVTACHDLLAMEIAGREGARLYPGSWSEWISDPSRPVERG